jgi:hypothetical protein
MEPTNAGQKIEAICRDLIRKREMKNARTSEDYCFWMHHDTAADLYLWREKNERMVELTFAFGLHIFLDPKMEYGEIACVRKETPLTNKQ